jgi:hypothetical protein
MGNAGILQFGIISEQINRGVKNIVRNVINKDDKQKRAQDTTLWHPRPHGQKLRGIRIYFNKVLTIIKVPSKPLPERTSDTNSP